MDTGTESAIKQKVLEQLLGDGNILPVRIALRVLAQVLAAFFLGIERAKGVEASEEALLYFNEECREAFERGRQNFVRQ